MFNDFPLYTTDYISGVMSLRKPQTKSLKILEEITNAVPLRKGMNLKAALGAVHAMYPICTDFERDFMSLTFALATGVGKTRLMALSSPICIRSTTSGTFSWLRPIPRSMRSSRRI